MNNFNHMPMYFKQDLINKNPMNILDFSINETSDSSINGASFHKSPLSSMNNSGALYHHILNSSQKINPKFYLPREEEIKTEVVDVNMSPSNGSSPTSTEQKMTCPHCTFGTSENSELATHIHSHFLERLFADPSCNYCATLNNYKIERMTNNFPNQIHPCTHCNMFSTDVQNAVDHLKTHLNEASCLCKNKLKTNIKDISNKKPESHLDISNLTAVKKKDSDIVDKEKKYQCQSCSYSAHRSQNLRRHTMVHTGERPHPCNVCPYKAHDISSLKVHMKTHTGERPFPCPHCHYRATQKSTLKNHLKVHTGEKPYPCPHCSYRSSNQTNLSSHIKTHTGEKPYSCPHCSYCATQSSALKCHVRTHTGEKPYSCNQCPYRAAALGNLRSHLKVHAAKNLSGNLNKNDNSTATDSELDGHSSPENLLSHASSTEQHSSLDSQDMGTLNNGQQLSNEKAASNALSAIQMHVRSTMAGHLQSLTFGQSINSSITPHEDNTSKFTEGHIQSTGAVNLIESAATVVGHNSNAFVDGSLQTLANSTLTQSNRNPVRTTEDVQNSILENMYRIMR